jgi:hypothetical protein
MKIRSMRATNLFPAVFAAAACVAIAGCGQQPAPAGTETATDPAAAPSPEPSSATVTGTLSCGRINEWEAFDREVKLLIDGAKITTEDLGIEPKKEDFDTWSGQIADGKVTLSGRYKQYGQKNPRPVNLAGTYADGQIRLEGTRGPRKCTYVSTRIEPRG